MKDKNDKKSQFNHVSVVDDEPPGETLLHILAKRQDAASAEVVRVLIQHGVDVNSGSSPQGIAPVVSQVVPPSVQAIAKETVQYSAAVGRESEAPEKAKFKKTTRHTPQ